MGQMEMKCIFDTGKNISTHAKVTQVSDVAHGPLVYNKAQYYVMLHFYLQQQGIIKMLLLCNIPSKVPLFFLYKQDIM